MKVILLENIKGVGKKGELLKVSDGHARNFLLPKKLAVEATKSNVNELETKQQAEENKKRQQLSEAEQICEQLQNSSVNLPVKLGANGKLFGSVTSKEISKAISEQTGIEVDKKKIVLEGSVKGIGEYQIAVKLHQKVTAHMVVKIVKM